MSRRQVEQRIGLIGGLSWESTATYYKYFNQLAAKHNNWSQPKLLIDSLDFGVIVPFQQAQDWAATGEILANSARRLVNGGATIIGIGANTMHINFEAVQSAVDVPVIDVRTAVAQEVISNGFSKMALLGTKYVLEEDFYSDKLSECGITVIKPDSGRVDELQKIVFDELTQGIVRNDSRKFLIQVSNECITAGAEVIGLCCTEFGLLLSENEVFPSIDSTKAHVRALLAYK